MRAKDVAASGGMVATEAGYEMGLRAATDDADAAADGKLTNELLALARKVGRSTRGVTSGAFDPSGDTSAQQQQQQPPQHQTGAGLRAGLREARKHATASATAAVAGSSASAASTGGSRYRGGGRLNTSSSARWGGAG